MTFSIVARCRNTGMFGIAVTSSSPAVAARCAFAEAGVGAVATQNITDPSLGKRGLGLLRAEADALETVDTLLSSTEHMDYRQVMVIDRLGDAAIHSGKHTLGTWGEAVTKNAAAAGNLLADKSVPRTMIHAFEETENANMHLADRLMDALKAGLAAGGEPGLERVHQPVGQVHVGVLGFLERMDHGARHGLVGEQVTRRRRILGDRLAPGAQRVLARMNGGVAQAVDYHDLPIVHVFGAAEQRVDGLQRVRLGAQQAEPALAERRVGNILCRDGADACFGEGAACGDRRTRRRHCDAEHAGVAAPGDD